MHCPRPKTFKRMFGLVNGKYTLKQREVSFSSSEKSKTCWWSPPLTTARPTLLNAVYYFIIGASLTISAVSYLHIQSLSCRSPYSRSQEPLFSSLPTLIFFTLLNSYLHLSAYLLLLFKIKFKPKPQAENLHKLGSHKLRINQIPNGIHQGVTENFVQSLSSKNSFKLLLLIYYNLLLDLYGIFPPKWLTNLPKIQEKKVNSIFVPSWQLGIKKQYEWAQGSHEISHDVKNCRPLTSDSEWLHLNLTGSISGSFFLFFFFSFNSIEKCRLFQNLNLILSDLMQV